MKNRLSCSATAILALAVFATPIEGMGQEIFNDGFESGNTSQWSQTTTFSPSNIQDLWGWWDAGIGVGTVDGLVSQWDDQSGNGRNWVQTNADNRPKYVPITQADRPALQWIRFNDDWMDLADGINPAGNDIEIFAVARSTIDFKWASIVQQRSVPGYGRPWLFFSDNDLQSHIGGTPVQGTDAVDAFAVNVYHASYDDSEGILGVFKNGSSVASATDVVGESCTGDLYLGRSEGEFNIEGFIFEIVIYDRALSPSERSSVVDYLQEKWQTSWPTESTLPSEINDLWAWWMADQGVLFGVGGIAYWQDQSGNDVTLQQSIYGRRPQLVAGAQNSLPGILIDDIDDHLETLEDTLDFATEDATIFLVMNTQNDNSAPIAGLDGPTGIGRAWYENEPGVGRVYIGGFPAPLSLDGGGVFGPSVLTVYFNGASQITQYGVNEWIWEAATGVVGESNTDGGTRVGNAKFDQNVFDGLLHEIVIFNRALTWTERQAVINYLNTKWAIF